MHGLVHIIIVDESNLYNLIGWGTRNNVPRLVRSL